MGKLVRFLHIRPGEGCRLSIMAALLFLLIAAIVVTESPYFAVSDERGLFSFDSVPTGTYEIEIWHERLEFQHHRISVGTAAPTDVDIVYALNQKST